jgi:hypothetical protein
MMRRIWELIGGLAVVAVLTVSGFLVPLAAHADVGAGPAVAVAGVTENDTFGPLTLVSSSASGGTFTTPPHPVVPALTRDSWDATVPDGSVTLAYQFDGDHTVTFTDPADSTGTCAITPADPTYHCSVQTVAGTVTDFISQAPPIAGKTVNHTAGTMTLTGTSDPGGTFTTPPASSLASGAASNWVATEPASGPVTLAYQFDGAHTVTFTDAGTSQSCTITPADPGYACTTNGTPSAPVDTLTGPAAA